MIHHIENSHYFFPENNSNNLQTSILDNMKVKSNIDIQAELIHRVKFIKNRLLTANLTKLVIDFDHSIDALVCSYLVQRAIDELNQQQTEKKYEYVLVSSLLKENTTIDEKQSKLQPLSTFHIDLEESTQIAYNTVWYAFKKSNYNVSPTQKEKHFCLTELKARLAMATKYYIANHINALVIGLENASKSIIGSSTKYGQSAADLHPLFGLTESQIQQMANELNITKTEITHHTALQTELMPYDMIDTFLEADPISSNNKQQIMSAFQNTQDKRNLPFTIFDDHELQHYYPQNKDNSIISTMRVQPEIDNQKEIQLRQKFIEHVLLTFNVKNLVLGISGGIDSSTCGKLTQTFIDENNQKTGKNLRFFAVRLPYGRQKDHEDAQLALNIIQPSVHLDVNIKAPVDNLFTRCNSELQKHHLFVQRASKIDFDKGNLKARMRMILQYLISDLVKGVVLGTDHSAENITGFYTKHGDGACDLAPLFGLNKRQIRSIARDLNIPESLVEKTPTADLEELAPNKADEDALAISYDQIDDYLENKTISSEVKEKLENIFHKTQHKREMPYTPSTL